MDTSIFVLFGSHDGIEDHRDENLRLLKRLIHLHHGSQVPDDRIATGRDVAETYNSFIANTAKYKYLYFVGHGDKNGNLMFTGGELLDLGSFTARPNHWQFLELYLFMCYEYKAYERLHTATIVNRLPIGITRHEYTQNVRDEINVRSFAYQLMLDDRGVLTQTTKGDPLLGHFFLSQEVRNAECSTQAATVDLFMQNA